MKSYYHIILIICLLSINFTWAQNKNSHFSGLVGLQLDATTDSKNSDGSKNTNNLFFKAQFLLNYTRRFNNGIEIGGGLRSGSYTNPQSPFITFGNRFNNFNMSLNKVYIKYKFSRGYVWTGKHPISLWRFDELLWDKDVNPEGISAYYRLPIYSSWFNSISMNAGYFLVANKMNSLSQENRSGTMMLAQPVFKFDLFNAPMTVASTFIKTFSLSENYAILATSMSYKTNYSINIYANYFHNFENYQTIVDPAFENKTNGYSLALGYGITRRLSTKITYANIEKYAVIDRFAQDNWIQWKDTNYTRSSNFRGFELGVKYRFSFGLKAQLKLWKVVGITKASNASNLETGTRLQLDLNMRL